MNIITAKPNTSQSEGYVELDVGERGHVVVEGAVNFPVSDQFAQLMAQSVSPQTELLVTQRPAAIARSVEPEGLGKRAFGDATTRLE
mgnify:CR=1 FL=1